MRTKGPFSLKVNGFLFLIRAADQREGRLTSPHQKKTSAFLGSVAILEGGRGTDAANLRIRREPTVPFLGQLWSTPENEKPIEG